MKILEKLLEQGEISNMDTPVDELEAFLSRYCVPEKSLQIDIDIPFTWEGGVNLEAYRCDIPGVGTKHVVVEGLPDGWQAELTEDPVITIESRLRDVYDWFADTLPLITDPQVFEETESEMDYIEEVIEQLKRNFSDHHRTR